MTSINRRSALLGATTALIGGWPATLAACRGSSVSPEALTVRRFYAADHGANLQPAFQAALDEAARTGTRKIVNDIGPVRGEMWCPVRRLPTGDGLDPDGVPLVVKRPVHIDFAGMEIRVKGPGGGSRVQARVRNSLGHPWLGGWIYVIGGRGFDLIELENVKVLGDFAGSLTTNNDTNWTDKGFRIQDTDVAEVRLRNVEIGRFAGEVYYIGGVGPKLQTLDNCHFHSSAQCAFNPGGFGRLVANNLQAGNAYQAAEAIGGAGHRYIGGRFYDCGSANFLGGPSPRLQPGFPFWYAYWDGRGSPPFVEFEGTRFEKLWLRLGSWMRGRIVTRDASVALLSEIGHLRDVRLEVESWCDRGNNSEAVSLDGPRNLVTQVPETPRGTYVRPPSNIALQILCRRTNAARAANRRHSSAVRFYGGLLDTPSISVRVSGEAARAWEVLGKPARGFEPPRVVDAGLRVLG